MGPTRKQSIADDRSWPTAGGHQRPLHRRETRGTRARRRAALERADGLEWVDFDRTIDELGRPVCRTLLSQRRGCRQPVDDLPIEFSRWPRWTASCGYWRPSASAAPAIAGAV